MPQCLLPIPHRSTPVPYSCKVKQQVVAQFAGGHIYFLKSFFLGFKAIKKLIEHDGSSNLLPAFSFQQSCHMLVFNFISSSAHITCFHLVFSNIPNMPTNAHFLTSHDRTFCLSFSYICMYVCIHPLASKPLWRLSPKSLACVSVIDLLLLSLEN